MDQILALGSQRTKATPPSTVLAAAIASPPSFLGDDKISVGFLSYNFHATLITYCYIILIIVKAL